MNRVQRGFLALLVVMVLMDVGAAEVVAVTQGATFLASLRDATLITAVLLFAGGILLGGSTRAFPIEEGVENSPMFTTPRFGRVLRQDRANQASGVSDYPILGVIYGAIFFVVALILYVAGA